ncbi:hypothetical protein BS78_05G182500 [Paspalum vaginatum]|nr:hypothetical protein BS78_05G182500 [Paspalum vaginatum]
MLLVSLFRLLSCSGFSESLIPCRLSSECHSEREHICLLCNHVSCGVYSCLQSCVLRQEY